MSTPHSDIRRLTRKVTGLADQTQEGFLLWSRTPPPVSSPDAARAVQPKEQFQADIGAEKYLLQVRVDRDGEIDLVLSLSEDSGDFADLARDEVVRTGLAPALRDLYRAVTAQRRTISLAAAGQGAADRTLATATDLRAWAERREAQAALPQLVRRLILATATDLVSVSVRAGEGVGLPGWDGLVEAAEWSPFVPQGLSVWEMGVGDPGPKAQSDYSKRTDDPDGVDPATTTFVFVSPRRWAGKDDWVRRRKAEGVWQDVRVIDGDDVETWLETAPAVHAWLSALVGKNTQEAESLETWWTRWSEATRPPLPPEVLLSGRGAEAERIKTFFGSPPGSTSIVADSRDEATAFLAAALSSSPTLLARAIVVYTPAAWRRLSAEQSPLLLIASFERPSVAETVQAGHHAVLPLGREAATSGGTTLPRLRRRGIETALREAGLPHDRASDLATLGRRSLFALRRTLAVNPDADRPVWAEPANARLVALATLAGSWHDSSEGDREALAALCGRPYGEIANALTEWANASNPPVRRVGDVWLVAAKSDTWALTAHALTSDDLDRFRRTATSVVGGDDPALDLPPEQRMIAGLVGKQRSHSAALVRGIADSLALLAVSDPDVALVGDRRGQTEAAIVVRDVLGAANEDPTGRRWHAASSVLPLLAEAAPEVFLRAVEAGSRDAESPVLTLFQDVSNSFSGSSPHPSLLWALETLAWSPDYLAPAVRRLAALARLAPPVKILNRPFNSLQSILVLWSNGTAAPPAQRVEMLDLLAKYEPEVAWGLALALIPSGSDATSPPASPVYRDWKPDDADRGVLADELDRALGGVLARACDYAGTDGARWAALLGSATASVFPVRDEVVTALEALDSGVFTPDGRLALYRTVREIVTRHRRFSDARWAMASESVDRLDALLSSFEPTRAADRLAWLFDQHAIDAFADDEDENNWSERQRRHDEAQDAALAEVLAELPVVDLAAWTDALSNPEFSARHVGESLARVRPDDPDALALVASPDVTARRIGSTYINMAARLRGLGWAETVLAEHAGAWDTETTSVFLRSLPTDPAVWRLADAQGEEVKTAYWSAVHPFALPSEGEEALTAARALTAAGRPRAALDLFRQISYRDKEAVPLDVLAATLEAALRSDDEPFGSVSAQDIGRHLDRLDEAEFDADRLAMLEWNYLPLFRFENRQSGVLHRALADEPDFFVQMLSVAYRARSEEPADLTEAEQISARNAHTLLESWRTVPGTQPDGSLDADALASWVREAQALLATADRREVGERHIGRVLRYGPKPATPTETPDSAQDAPKREERWPVEAVCDVIEEAASDEMESGFELEVYNSRGVTSRGLTDGGSQERALAGRYRRYAAAQGILYPRTSAMLRRLAESYERDAERQDRDADLTEDTWR